METSEIRLVYMRFSLKAKCIAHKHNSREVSKKLKRVTEVDLKESTLEGSELCLINVLDEDDEVVRFITMVAERQKKIVASTSKRVCPFLIANAK